MDDGPSEPAIDFIPTICFIARGVAKERPDKVVLTSDELARVINNAKDNEDDEEENEDDRIGESSRNQETEERMESENVEDHDMENEYNLNTYDEENATQVAGIGTIAAVDENGLVEDEDDSEAEDEIIKTNDNLLLVGHVTDDSATMEVWVFNEEEESLYAHHDFLLSCFPLCVEWLSHDPGSDKLGNMCAIGSMDPVITIWDLDIQDSYEPTFKLGAKGSRKNNISKYGHTDAVLDLSWNANFSHILASGSVDNTIILWDLDEGTPHTTLRSFQEKVQSIQFHPTEPQNLLTGCADGIVRIFDCRNTKDGAKNYIKWKVSSEVEKVIWNPSESNFFSIGGNDGTIHYADMRNPKNLLWSTQAHADEISGICFNPEVKTLLLSTSADGFMKIWKFNEREIQEVYRHDFDLGRIHCLDQCPEDPFTIVFGGEKVPRFRVYNIKNFEAVREIFELQSADEDI